MSSITDQYDELLKRCYEKDKRIVELEQARSRYQLRIVELEHALETIVERQDNVRKSDVSVVGPSFVYCYDVAIKALRCK